MDFLGAALDRSVWFLTRYWPAVAAALIAPFIPLERFVPRLGWISSARPAVSFIVGLSLLATISAGFVGGLPLPLYQDDFSYLLSADTFLEGRLANRPHAHWRHFETFYTLMRPTYASKYPPAQGMFLALGRLLSGVALSGMWIAAALMSAAIYWMLRGWLPPRWAFAGGVAAAIHPTAIDWSQSLHGGCIPALGGALLLGGIPRLLRGGRPGDGLATGFGVVLLANSRPYEGGVLVILIAIAAAILMRLEKAQPRFRPLASAVGIIVAGAAATMAYNYAVIGDPLELPFRAYDRQYASAPDFIWQQPYPPRHYRQKDMEQQYAIFRSYYQREREPSEWLRSARARLKLMLKLLAPLPRGTFSGIFLLQFLPLLALPFALPRRRVALLAAVMLMFTAALLQVTWWTQSHYPSPAAGLAGLLFLLALRQLSVWRRRQRHGRRLAVAAALVFLTVSLVGWYSIAHFSNGPYSPAGIRASIETRLGRMPGGHLVVVDQDVHDVVFNAADIDGSKIVWAHALSDTENASLLHYFSGRTVWRARAAARGARLELVRRPIRP